MACEKVNCIEQEQGCKYQLDANCVIKGSGTIVEYIDNKVFPTLKTYEYTAQGGESFVTANSEVNQLWLVTKNGLVMSESEYNLSGSTVYFVNSLVSGDKIILKFV